MLFGCLELILNTHVYALYGCIRAVHTPSTCDATRSTAMLGPGPLTPRPTNVRRVCTLVRHSLNSQALNPTGIHNMNHLNRAFFEASTTRKGFWR